MNIDHTIIKAITDEYKEAAPHFIAYAKSKIRELQWAILFAKSEPEYWPPMYDPDVGEFLPVRNDAIQRARNLAYEIVDEPAAMLMLAPFGWKKTDYFADWDTMLSHLPPISDSPISC